MAFVKLASLLLSLLLVFHALRDSSARVDLAKYASEESISVQQHQDQDKDLEATKQEVMNLICEDYQSPKPHPPRRMPTSLKPKN